MAQLVGTQSGQPIVPVYDWVNFFAGRFRSIPQLKSFQHFIFSSAHPGIVVLKAYSDSSETRFTMLNDDTWSPSTSMLPQTIRPSGLPLARKLYLYRQIRDYCRDGTEDLTCPKPSDPLDTTSQGSDRQQELSEEEEVAVQHIHLLQRNCEGVGSAVKLATHAGVASITENTMNQLST